LPSTASGFAEHQIDIDFNIERFEPAVTCLARFMADAF
jgi:hypothetical protein